MQKELANRIVLLQENPYNSRLHTKHLTAALAGFLSFRVSREYRVVFRFLDPGTIQLLRAADRKDIYRHFSD